MKLINPSWFLIATAASNKLPHREVLSASDHGILEESPQVVQEFGPQSMLSGLHSLKNHHKFQKLGECGNPTFISDIGASIYNANANMSMLRKKREAQDDPSNLRIVGGSEAKAHSWPWQVWVETYGGPYGSAICGGTLISGQWVLTAAHCAYNEGWGQVLIGAHDRIQDSGEDRKTVQIKQIYQHPSYNKPQTFAFDFALLELEMNYFANKNFPSFQVKPMPDVAAACLPGANTCIPAGTECIVSGWGLTHELERSAQIKLQEVKVQILSHSQCAGGLYNKNFIHRPSMFCAGWVEGQRDACAGDSGGPLVCRLPNTDYWQVYGVVSWGQGCGRSERPGVYGRVTEILPWIEEVSGVAPRAEPAPGGQVCYNDYPESWANKDDEIAYEDGDEIESLQWPPEQPEMVKYFDTSVGEDCNYDFPYDNGNFNSKDIFNHARYPVNTKCLWTFGLEGKAREEAARGEKTRGILSIETAGFYGMTKKQRCGSTDYIKIIDGNGKVISNYICVITKKSKARRHFEGVAPLYVLMVSNSDLRTGPGLVARYKTKEPKSSCALYEEYAVKTGRGITIQTPWWRYNNKKPSKKAPQIRPDTECTTVIRAPPNHWVECDTQYGGFNVPQSEDCKDHWFAMIDGLNPLAAEAKSSARNCGASRGKQYFRSSNQALSLSYKTGSFGKLSFGYKQQMKKRVMGGFRITCRAVKMALWFGEAKSTEDDGSERKMKFTSSEDHMDYLKKVAELNAVKDDEKLSVAQAELFYSMQGNF